MIFYRGMKKLKRTSTAKGELVNGFRREIGWEVRPGGLLVQKRVVGDESESSRHMIKIKVSDASYQHDIIVPAQSTFGALKKVLATLTGLEPKEQRLLYRGKERDDEEFLHMVGVQEMSKVVLLEDPASKERKLEDMKRNNAIARALEAVAQVRAEVHKLSNKVVALEMNVHGGTKVEDKQLLVLIELLMMQLLKLDAIEADGEAKVQRKIEVRHVQSLVDTLDNLKAKNSNPCSKFELSETTKGELLDSGVGSFRASVPLKSSTIITNEWESFD